MNIQFYTSIVERKQLKKQATSRKETVLHDDFVDARGKATNGTSGRLTFDISPPSIIPVVNVREEALKEKVRTGVDLDLLEMNELLRSDSVKRSLGLE